MAKVRPRVFCASLSDWLDDEVPIEWLADLLKLIHETPNLDWLLLTKRPENWKTRVVDACENTWTRSCDANTQAEREALKSVCLSSEKWISGESPSNIWIGTSVENQAAADERIPELLKIPAKVRFLSVEPMIGPVEFSAVTGRSDAVLQLGKKAIDGIHWVICGGESGPGKRPMDLAWARSLRDQCAAEQVPFFMKQVDKVQAIPADLMVREFPNFSGVSWDQVKETV